MRSVFYSKIVQLHSENDKIYWEQQQQQFIERRTGASFIGISHNLCLRGQKC